MTLPTIPFIFSEYQEFSKVVPSLTDVPEPRIQVMDEVQREEQMLLKSMRLDAV